jgi:hypothetical protein
VPPRTLFVFREKNRQLNFHKYKLAASPLTCSLRHDFSLAKCGAFWESKHHKYVWTNFSWRYVHKSITSENSAETEYIRDEILFLFAACLLGLLSHLDEGGSNLFQNVGKPLSNYTTACPRRYSSSELICLLCEIWSSHNGKCKHIDLLRWRHVVCRYLHCIASLEIPVLTSALYKKQEHSLILMQGARNLSKWNLLSVTYETKRDAKQRTVSARVSRPSSYIFFGPIPIRLIEQKNRRPLFMVCCLVATIIQHTIRKSVLSSVILYYFQCTAKGLWWIKLWNWHIQHIWHSISSHLRYSIIFPWTDISFTYSVKESRFHILTWWWKQRRFLKRIS